MKNPTSLWSAQAGNLECKNFIQDESAGGKKGEELQKELLHFAWCTMCTNSAPATKSKTKQNNKTQPQHLSKFFKIIQIVKAALGRRLKCSGLQKCPWKNSASPTAIILIHSDHDTKGEVYLSTSVTTDKTTKEKDLYSSVSTALHGKGGA